MRTSLVGSVIVGSRFVGRSGELHLLRRRFEGVASGSGSVVLIAGEPGIGKTSLAAEAAHAAGTQGLTTVWAHCGGMSASAPYRLWRQLADGLTATHAVAPVVVSGSEDRFAVFERYVAVVRRAAAQRPVYLVIDDMHEADDDSLGLLRFAIPALQDVAVALVATYRDTDISAGSAIDTIVGQLAGRRHVDLIRLTGLTVAETAAMMAGVAQQARAEDVYARTDGNPFLVRELIGSGVAVPAAVAAAVRERMRFLPPGAADVVRCAAMIGRDVRVALVAAALDAPAGAVVAMLDAAAGQGIVTSSGTGGSDYSFTHDLFREALDGTVTGPQRFAMHERIAGALESTANGDPLSAPVIAHHACAAVRDDLTRRRAQAAAVAAADAAVAITAYEGALMWYLRADSLAPVVDPLPIDALMGWAAAAQASGDLRLARSLLERAWARCCGTGGNGSATRIALALGRLVEPSGRPDGELVRVLEAALAGLPPGGGPHEVALRARLAVEQYWGDVVGARHAARQAVTVARGLNDGPALAAALAGLQYTLRGPGHLDERVQVGAELAGLARRCGDVEWELDAHRILFSDRLRSDPAFAADELDALDELRRRTGRPLVSWYANLFRAIRATIAGRTTEAQGLLDDVESLGDRMGLRATRVFVTAQRLLLSRDVGSLADHEGPLRSTIEAFPGIAGLRCQLVLLLADLGRDAEARALLADLTDRSCADIPDDLVWMACIASLAETAAILDDGPTCAALYRRLLPHRGMIAEAGPAGWCGAVDRHLGLAATVIGRWDDADRHFDAALRLHQRWGAIPLSAATLRNHAAMFRRRAEHGDGVRARQLESAAAALWPAYPVPPRTESTSGQRGRLTRREHEVLTLLADGATNRAIAEKLVLSVHTVERHVANIYTKIGVRNRAEATAYALTTGTVSGKLHSSRDALHSTREHP